MTNPPPAPPPAPHGRRWKGPLVFALVVAGLLLVLVVAVKIEGYPAAREWVESPAGQRQASQGLGKTIKVDGQFAPLQLEDWTIRTDSFTSKGWPGEAIGYLNARNIVAEFDPWAVFKGAWRIKSIQLAQADFELVAPVDALKRPVPPKRPRPWYLFFLPSRFECGPIVCPHANVFYSFQDKAAQIRDAQVRADLIVRDLKYTATSGTLVMPYLPPLHINRLELLVTRPEITVYTAQLAGLDPHDPARLTLNGRMGMREDKSIDVQGDFTGLPLDQILPEELRPLVQGTASGHLIWKRDRTGQALDSDGELTLSGARLRQLSVFRQLKLLNDNPSIDDFTFDQAACRFHLHGGRATIDLTARAPGKFALSGTVAYQLATKWADLDLTITDLPLQTWLPTEFKPTYAGFARAHLQWHGRLDTIKDASGNLSINLDGARITKPVLLRRLLQAKGLQTPDEIAFRTARFEFAYQDQTLELTGADLDVPGMMTVHLQGSLRPEKLLKADVTWQGLRIENWLPSRFAHDFSGDINGHVQITVRQWKMENGQYGGSLKLLNGQLSYTPFQRMLARFVGDRELLIMPLTRAELAWTWDGGKLDVHDLNLRAGDRLGVKGGLAVNDQKLSGRLWIGTKPAYLDWFSGLGNAVFNREEEGLRWARVDLGGTVKKPTQDFSSQLLAQLATHPLAIVGLSAKLISWYVGDWFDEAKDWQRPEVDNRK